MKTLLLLALITISKATIIAGILVALSAIQLVITKQPYKRPSDTAHRIESSRQTTRIWAEILTRS